MGPRASQDLRSPSPIMAPGDFLCSNRDKTKAYFEKRADIPAETSGHFQLHALITCNSAKHFANDSELFPV